MNGIVDLKTETVFFLLQPGVRGGLERLFPAGFAEHDTKTVPTFLFGSFFPGSPRSHRIFPHIAFM